MGASGRSATSYEAIATELGITVREVKLIEKRGLQKLRNYVIANCAGYEVRNGTSRKPRIWLSILKRYWEDG